MTFTEAFARDGWAIARSVVSPDEIVALNELFVSILPEGAAWPPRRDGVVGEVSSAANSYPALARFARDSRFGELAAQALGSPRVQLLQDSLLFKPAREGGSVEWHQDYTYLGFLKPPQVVTLRVALLPEAIESGCMQAVGGSHHWGLVGDVRALTEDRVDSLVPSLSSEQRDALGGAVPLVLQPGDVSIHHCLTLHGSGPNRAANPRRTILLRMFGDEARLDAAALPSGAEAYFPTDNEGRLSPSAFPVVFGR